MRHQHRTQQAIIAPFQNYFIHLFSFSNYFPYVRKIVGKMMESYDEHTI